MSILLLLCLLPGSSGAADDDVGALIERLGDRNWKVRDEAEAKLLSLGKAVVPDLEEALDHPDAEIRWRAEKLIRKLRWRITGELRETLGPLFDDYEALAIDERLNVVQTIVERLGADGVDLLLRIGRDDEETQVREAALNQAHALGGKETEETILEALEEEEDFWARRWAALLRLDRGETEQALAECRAAFRKNPHDQELNAAYVRLLQEGDLWDESTRVLVDLKEEDPENPLYRVLLARSLEEEGRTDEASAELEAAIGMEPEDQGAYITIIRACIDMGKDDLALRFIQSSEAIHPGDPAIRVLRGEVLEARGNWDAAFRLYTTVFQSSEPESTEHVQWRGKIRSILEKRGEGDLATDALLDEIHSGAIHAALWRRMGDVYRKMGLSRLAVEEYRRTLIFTRNEPALLIALAEAYLEAGKTDEAKETAARALEGESLSAGVVARLEALRDGPHPVTAPAGMAPLLWKWRPREDEEWQRTADRNRFDWKIPPVGCGEIVVFPIYGSDTVVGLDGRTGVVRWRREPPDPPPAPGTKEALLDLAWILCEEGAPLLIYNIWHSVPGKFRLTGRPAGLIGVVLDGKTGEVQRRFEADASIDGVPSNIDKASIAFVRGRGLGDRSVVLLDLGRGEVVWSRRFRSLSDLGLHIGGGRVWIVLEGGTLLALDLESGEEAWRKDLGSAQTCPPITDEVGGVFVATSKGRLLRLDGESGEPTWSADLSEIASRLSLLPGGRLLAAHRGGTISAWTARGGERLWETNPGRSADRVFAGAEDFVAALNGGRNSFWDERAQMVALDPKDGTVRWRFECGLGAHLTLHGGQVVLADGDLRRSFRLAGLSASIGPPDDDVVAQTLHVEASARSDRGQKQVALALLEKAIDLSERPEQHLSKARILRGRREYDRARKALDRGEGLEGADKEAFRLLREEIEAEIEAREEARTKRDEERARALERQAGEQEKQDEEGEEEEPEEDPPREGVPLPPWSSWGWAPGEARPIMDEMGSRRRRGPRSAQGGAERPERWN